MKRKHAEDHVNHEAWAIPYADLMTLLLAFFVVMYAVSVVNEGKYRVMSESIIEAFNGSSHVIAALPEQRVRPHNVDPAIATPPGQPGAAAAAIAIPIPLRPAAVHTVPVRAPHTTLAKAQAAPAADAKASAEARRQADLTRIQNQVEQALQPLIDKKMVMIRRNANWLEIEIRTDILFPSGVAQLSRPADDVLSRLAGILAPFGNPLRVEGYTDDKPISTAVYPSNWELSAARAASVARLFTDHGISPARLGIIGWGQFRPAADNTTVEGRNRNRRVLVVVLSDHATPMRYSGGAERAGQLADAAVPAATPAVTSGVGAASATLLPAAGLLPAAAPPARYAPARDVPAPIVVTPERFK
jgi:chemotaxis protein MotB